MPSNSRSICRMFSCENPFLLIQSVFELNLSVSSLVLESVNFLCAVTLGRKNIISVLGDFRRYSSLQFSLPPITWKIFRRYVQIKNNYIVDAVLLDE